MKEITPTATLLQLLQLGCTITLPTGYSFRGDTAYGYIDCIAETERDGLRELSEVGLKEAIKDSLHYAESFK